MFKYLNDIFKYLNDIFKYLKAISNYFKAISVCFAKAAPQPLPHIALTPLLPVLHLQISRKSQNNNSKQ